MVHVREHADGPLATASGRARRPPSTGLRISAATTEIVHPPPGPPAASEARREAPNRAGQTAHARQSSDAPGE
ncbi:hypothetical protein CV102_14015 [Natronococcus pandeyae]|uniref:Uncharacterized protein n=1 Tax=Natronococcus pandeyae TaxID=2055836 RepID=A0A8J8Q1S2_9EURY|nr:hypothetical protein CV102_14015 [Natronococcus pandeyae]